jgi:AcrR family transcriptional regulator
MTKPISTTRMTQRQVQAAARREQLLAVTLDLFAEKGVHGTSIRDIAQAAGITEGLIYHYFPSKSALLQAVIERYDFLEEIMRLGAQVEDVPVREALVQLCSRFLELLTRNRKYVTMIHTESMRDPEVAQSLGGHIAPGLAWAQGFIQGRIATGELRPHDAAVSVRLIHHSLLWFGLMQERLSPPLPPIDPETFVRGAVEVLLDGIAASPSGERHAAGNKE